jgi:hypothetical protein
MDPDGRRELRTKFLTNTDETGRFIVYSSRTGRSYYVEPIGNVKTGWGSIDPATKKVVNKPGAGKYRGSIDEEDSLITPENGFEKIHMLEPGTSPLHAIDVLDSKYPDKK